MAHSAFKTISELNEICLKHTDNYADEKIHHPTTLIRVLQTQVTKIQQLATEYLSDKQDPLKLQGPEIKGQCSRFQAGDILYIKAHSYFFRWYVINAMKPQKKLAFLIQQGLDQSHFENDLQQLQNDFALSKKYYVGDSKNSPTQQKACEKNLKTFEQTEETIKKCTTNLRKFFTMNASALPKTSSSSSSSSATVSRTLKRKEFSAVTLDEAKKLKLDVPSSANRTISFQSSSSSSSSSTTPNLFSPNPIHHRILNFIQQPDFFEKYSNKDLLPALPDTKHLAQTISEYFVAAKKTYSENPDEIYQLGCSFEKEAMTLANQRDIPGAKSKLEAAFNLHRAAVALDHSAAKIELGKFYLTGKMGTDVPLPNMNAALHLFSERALAGNIMAFFCIAFAFLCSDSQHAVNIKFGEKIYQALKTHLPENHGYADDMLILSQKLEETNKKRYALTQ